MEQGPYWETNSSSACQEIPFILWNLRVRYHVHRSLPHVTSSSFILVSVLQQVHSIFQSEFSTECDLVLPFFFFCFPSCR
jgi:hypothetical protein